ncbi:hypothetical protein ALC60_11321 [Trachymyrmex zeteki]|uniref:Uncharacterized protein n=1 Tax=Mycetomoellerius zeteki TaxID=64791 RepID=A0A151WP64_9HYME|nr:hypothetical protein ALC60_11321 [Trachymyrmex zeteki]
MHEYALLGRKMSLNYAVVIYSLMSLYMMVPLTVPILDFLMPLNTSRPYIYLFDVDYSFDREIYYYLVLVHSYIIVVLAITSMIINDTSYISLTQHACGLFAAIGYRIYKILIVFQRHQLENLINLKKSSFVKDVKVTYNKCESNDDIIYREMIFLLWKHQLSLEYIDLVESLFKMYLLIMIIMNLIGMSLLGFQIITFMNKKVELLTYVSMLIGGFIHLFVLSYPGQEIIDHSTDIFHKAYNMLWYRMSRRTTQLLRVLLRRSLVPCTLTAGNMYVIRSEYKLVNWRLGEMQSAVKHYYNINKILLSKLGSWPTQSKLIKILLPTIIMSFVFSIGFLEFVRLSETWQTITEDCECFIMIIISFGAYCKLFIIVFKNKNIEHLLSLIDYHWRVFTHTLEIQIMHEYAVVARRITISYAVMIYSLMSLYMLIPVTPQLLDLFIPLNKSRSYKYLFDIDYSFDREVYYYPVLLHSYLTTVLTMSLMVITDTSYMSLAQHACSLFAAIGHRLENLISESSSKKSNYFVEDIKDVKDVKDVICNKSKSQDYEDETYRELVLLVRKHQLSIEYVRLLNSLFEMYSFMLLFVTIIIISLLGIQVSYNYGIRCQLEIVLCHQSFLNRASLKFVIL